MISASFSDNMDDSDNKNSRSALFIDSFSALTPRITGGMSAVSSSILIYLILHSDAKLNTIYHRIMFAMSLFDILGSIAMGLSTVPMPKDLYYDAYWYLDEWVGTRLGNTETCKAQGFSFMLGTWAMYAYNSSLCMYYACTLCFKMKERNIVKFVEPVLHLFPIILGCAIAISHLIPFDITNSNLASMPWCVLRSGRKKKNTSNLTGVPSSVKKLDSVLFLIGSILGLIVISFALIIWKVIQTQRFLKNANSMNTRVPGNGNKRILQRRGQLLNTFKAANDNTKVIVVQAAMYVCAFLVTLLPLFLRNAIRQSPLWIAKLIPILMPLQGFFNLIIYIGHRIYNYRRIHPDVRRKEVMRMLFLGKANDSVLLSRISIISINSNREVTKIQVEDESHNVDYIDIEFTDNDNIEVFSDNVMSKDLSVGIDTNSLYDLSIQNNLSAMSHGISFSPSYDGKSLDLNTNRGGDVETEDESGDKNNATKDDDISFDTKGHITKEAPDGEFSSNDSQNVGSIVAVISSPAHKGWWLNQN